MLKDNQVLEDTVYEFNQVPGPHREETAHTQECPKSRKSRPQLTSRIETGLFIRGAVP